MAPPVVELVRGEGHDPDDFVRELVRRASGNFQYLEAYRRGLDDAIERGDGPTAARLLRFTEPLSGLDALYGLFMTTAQADIVRMGQVAAREPAAPRPDAWRDVGRPILGVLTVAREPLTANEIIELADLTASREAVGDVLRRLRWLFDLRDGRAALFHASLAEFLTRGDPADPAGPSWLVDEPYWHGRIVRHYRGDAASWDVLDWRSVDRYGLIHLVWHVLASSKAATALDLVCPGLRHAIRTAFGTDRHFLRITEPVAEALPAVLFPGVVRRRLLSAVRSLPPAVLGLMARMGRTQEALEHLRALPPSAHQFEGLREILRYLPEREQADDLVELLVEIALVVGEAKRIYAAAQALAPSDLERAPAPVAARARA
jgi:hypothetical protein